MASESPQFTDASLAEIAQTEQVRGVFSFLVFAALGGFVGLLVAGLEWFTVEAVLEGLVEAPRWLQIVAPGLGLSFAALLRYIFRDQSTSTSDDYVKSFHSGERLRLSTLGPRLTGSIATIGTGGAVGFEGPSVLLGATFGQWIGAKWPKIVGFRSDRTLLIAGAAAGVAAVFKAPATGVLFALEVPYRRDISRHALIPALVAAASAYLVFVLLLGSDSLIEVAIPEFDFSEEIGGAIVLGFASGIVARGLVQLFSASKAAPKKIRARYLIPVSGIALALSVVAAGPLVDLPVTLGPGANAVVNVVLDPGIGVWTIVALFLLRAVATSATLAGGGLGGVFIPLAVQGLLLGRIVEVVFDAPSTGLFPVIGLAAVLGAGYRTPLAAVMFVAETTGRAEFVIPALIATAVSQALMGEKSISQGQVSARQGALERRLGLPVRSVAVTEMGQVSSTDSLLEVIDRYGVSPPAPAVPVIDEDEGYVGLLVLHDMANIMFTVGIEATVGDCMRKNVESVSPDDPAMKAARLMNDSDTAAVAIIENGQAVGVVSAMSLTGLREVESDDFLDRPGFE